MEPVKCIERFEATHSRVLALVLTTCDFGKIFEHL